MKTTNIAFMTGQYQLSTHALHAVPKCLVTIINQKTAVKSIIAKLEIAFGRIYLRNWALGRVWITMQTTANGVIRQALKIWKAQSHGALFLSNAPRLKQTYCQTTKIYAIITGLKQ